MEKGEGGKEKGEGRKEKGEGRKEKGEGRMEKGERRKEKGNRKRGAFRPRPPCPFVTSRLSPVAGRSFVRMVLPQAMKMTEVRSGRGMLGIRPVA